MAEIFDLSGKGAVGTGGGMGIGEGIALRLAEAGAGVLIADTNLEAANRTVEKIKSRNGKAYAIHADVASRNDSQRVVETSVKTFRRLDILVNNAGIFNMIPAIKITEKAWDKVMNVNLKGLFFLTQAAALEMIRAGNGGRIINIASKDAIHPAGKMAHYDSSKAGVVMLTKSLALEFGRHNILVNAVVPGAIVTPGGTEMFLASGRPPEEVLYDALGGNRRVPLQRLGRPDDIARVVLFLSSAAADYITGTSILVDGGFLLT